MQDITYLVLSFSYKSMDLALREKLAFTDNEIVEFLTKVRNDENIKEAVLLSTCNRVEVYVIVRDSQKAIICQTSPPLCFTKTRNHQAKSRRGLSHFLRSCQS